jgi:hypothetical protein
MRRVRLEKLCEMKKCQTERTMRRTADPCFGSGRAVSTPELFASASRATVSVVRSSTSFNPAGLIVIQSDPGILPQAGRCVRPPERLKH